jgi:hypothetical protein
MTRRSVQPLALALLALAGWLGAVAFSGCARGGTDAEAVDILVATASGYERYLRSDAPDVLRYTSRLTGPVRAESGSAPADLRMVYYTDGRVSATVDLHLDTARGTGWARQREGVPPTRRGRAFRSGPAGWAQQDSNLRPRDYESPALTAELWAREAKSTGAGRKPDLRGPWKPSTALTPWCSTWAA